MENENYLLVNSKILPPVFEGVLRAKEMLADGSAKNASQASQMAGISRSAFYKYKDFVYRFNTNQSHVKIMATLADKKGVFSAMTNILSKYGANIITVNQNMPVDGFASVSITLQTDEISIPFDDLISKLLKADGVISVKKV